MASDAIAVDFERRFGSFENALEIRSTLLVKNKYMSRSNFESEQQDDWEYGQAQKLTNERTGGLDEDNEDEVEVEEEYGE